MANKSPKVYIATALLEKNRWNRLNEDRKPSFLVSEWAQKIAEAGFDGIELWQNHLAMASPEERVRMETIPCPIRIFNSYAGFADTDDDGMRQFAIEAVRRYHPAGVKFNVGHDPELRRVYLRNIKEWASLLPASCRPLCECHGGTIVDKPDSARRFFEEAALERWGIIVHGMAGTADDLRAWLNAFGTRIEHVHVYIRTGEEREALCRERVGILMDAGFAGSFTIEFTMGVGEANENMSALFESAVRDMNLVRDARSL